MKSYLLTGVLAAWCAASLTAAPKLQLASTSLPQVTVAAGVAASSLSVDALNIGDGSLNLTVSATASWLVPTVGAAHTCTSGTGSCLPIQIALKTSSLAAGTYAGLVSVYDPKAIDAPQNINVSVQVGSGVPSNMDFSVTPGDSAAAIFSTVGLVSIKAATTDKGTWLTALQSGGSPFSPTIPYTVTTASGILAVGNYTGTLAISGPGNAAKTIAVSLHVVAQPITTPLALVGGAVNNTTFALGESLAQGDIVALFGSQFVSGNPVPAASLPLATTLDNVQVLLNGQPVPLYYVSSVQINLQIPFDAQIGVGTLQVVSGSTNGNTISLTIAKAQPRILVLQGEFGGFSNYGIIIDASISSGADQILTIPTTAGIPSHPAKVGDVLTIYAIGLGPTNPVTASGAGAPSSPLAHATDNPQVCFLAPTPFDPKGLCVAPAFAGLTPGFAGLYQVNVTIPAGTPSATDVPIYLSTSDGPSNSVNIAVQ